MCKKRVMLFLLVVMLGFVNLVQAASPYFFSGGRSGNWAAGSTWDLGYPPSPTSTGDIAIVNTGGTVDVTNDGQGSTQAWIGYNSGTSVVNVLPGKDFDIVYTIALGYGGAGSTATGKLNSYGTTWCEYLNVGTTAGCSGIVNVYDSGQVYVGTWGFTIAPAGTAWVNLRGSGSMTVDSALIMTANGHLDIADGFLEVYGNQVSQLTTYKNNGWITAHGGTGTVNTPTYNSSTGYTTITAVPKTLPTTYFFSNTSGNWATSSTWNTGTVPVAGSATNINHAHILGNNVAVTSNQGSGHLSIGYSGNGTVGNVNVAAGSDLHVDYYLFVGQIANSPGVLDLYGTAYAKALDVAYAANTTGTVNVYDGGSLLVGEWACNIGTGGTTSIGRVNLKGNATMTVMTASGISMGTLPAYAKIDIEAGYLKVVGNQVTQLSAYIANGRITGYNGAATVATPVYTGGYTIVAVYPGSAASVPNPTNALSKVPLNKTLTWTAGTYATGHDVYWGTSSSAVANATRTSPEYKGNFSTNSYTDPNGFGRNIGQTHYWRIVETSGNGAIVRPNTTVWSFTTEHVRPPLSLARGITLDRPFTTMPVEPQCTIDSIDVKLIRYMGFDFAKVLISPELMISGDTINLTNMAYIDEVMAKFMAEGVPVVICIHPGGTFKTTYLGNWTNFTNLCSFYNDFAAYLAARWGVNEVAFQLMTEPWGNAWAWNNMWIHMYDQARAGMPNHTLILSGDQSGIIEGLVNDVNPDLRVDNNVLWSFTTYYPYAFTFQGAGWDFYTWLDQVPYPSNSSQNPDDYILDSIPGNLYSNAYNAVNAYLDAPWNMTKQRSILQPITTWKNNHPTSNPKIWCAEFGSMDQLQGSLYGGGCYPPDRIQFINDRRQAFEEIGIGWAYWSYNEPFTVFEPTLRVPFSDTPSYSWVDDANTLVALAVRNSGVIYFWSEQSGNWADPNTWDLGVPHTGNTPGHDVFVMNDNVTVANTQGSTDVHVGYQASGTLTVAAGATLNIDHSVLVGQSAGYSGVLNVYGAVNATSFYVADATNSNGTVNVYNGGHITLNGGCNVGTGTGSIGAINLKGNAYLSSYSTVLNLSATGKIDIESGYLLFVGDNRTLLTTYKNNGWITGYHGTGTVNAPTFNGTVTTITANP